ncbi:MAG: Holliday junction branch migration protein RuvA [Oscillospiraceae bacterium]|nr:Holliday junction branch migration protein RuvA [Oscillospiraceae bacterium]
MFYHIEGTVTELGPNLAVLDAGGIGFALNVTVNSLSRLKIGEKQKLYVSESIGETNFDLYGFVEKSEKRCFEMLIAVSGIGPKAALSILSYNSPESLALAILNDDVKALTVAPGIGKKIAQRVILELKDKIQKELGDSSWSLPSASVSPAAVPAAQDKQVSDAMAGLAVLGYSSAELTPILKGMDLTGMDAQAIIKAVLKQMVK